MLQRFEFIKICIGENENRNYSLNRAISPIKSTYLNAFVYVLSIALLLRPIRRLASYRLLIFH